MLIANPNASRNTYPDDLKAILNIQTAAESRTWLADWNTLNRAGTPLVQPARPGRQSRYRRAHDQG